jgi:hypothetical protein
MVVPLAARRAVLADRWRLARRRRVALESAALQTCNRGANNRAYDSTWLTRAKTLETESEPESGRDRERPVCSSKRRTSTSLIRPIEMWRTVAGQMMSLLPCPAKYREVEERRTPVRCGFALRRLSVRAASSHRGAPQQPPWRRPVTETVASCASVFLSPGPRTLCRDAWL